MADLEWWLNDEEDAWDDAEQHAEDCGILGDCWHSCISLGTEQCAALCPFRHACDRDHCDGHRLVEAYYEQLENEEENTDGI